MNRMLKYLLTVDHCSHQLEGVGFIMHREKSSTMKPGGLWIHDSSTSDRSWWVVPNVRKMERSAHSKLATAIKLQAQRATLLLTCWAVFWLMIWG